MSQIDQILPPPSPFGRGKIKSQVGWSQCRPLDRLLVLDLVEMEFTMQLDSIGVARRQMVAAAEKEVEDFPMAIQFSVNFG